MQPIIPILRVHGRYWMRHKLQAGLCMGGVTLGVALFCAIWLANDGALGAFAAAVDTFLGKATHRVYAPGGVGVPDDLFVRLATSPHVKAASPLLQGRIRLAGISDEVQVLGIDPLSDAQFRDDAFGNEPVAPKAQPSALASSTSDTPLTTLLSTPGAALVPQHLAAQANLHIGDVFRAPGPGVPAPFIVAGIFAPAKNQQNLLNTTLIVDVSTFQEVFGKRGKLDAIRLILNPGEEGAVAKLLPEGVAMEPLGRRLERVETMSHAFRLNLQVLGLFALLVGAFLILNAATFSVIQRETLVGLMRCIGASRFSIGISLLIEAVTVGAVGSLFGVLLGWVLAQRLVLGTSATIFEVILESEALPAAARLSPSIWALGLGVGMLTSIAGTLLPTLEIYRIAPLSVLQKSRWVSGQSVRLRRWILGAAFGAVVALAALSIPGESLEASLVAATAVILTGALLCPVALWIVGQAMSPALRRLFGPTGLLASRQLTRSITRTGLASASLMVALSLALAVGITVASFRHTFTLWLEQTITADLYLALQPNPSGATFDNDLSAKIRAQPQVADFEVLKTRRVTLSDREVQVIAVDGPTFGRLNRVPLRAGDRTEAIAALGRGEAWISETLANPLGMAVGSVLALPDATGVHPLRVAAVVQNYSAPNGLIYLDHAEFRRRFGDVPSRQGAIWLKPGANPEEASQALLALVGGDSLRITRNRDLRANALRVFDRTFAITTLMTGLATVVAFIAVISASAALLEERRQLIGYLRAIGVSRLRLGISMAMEAGLLAGVSCVVSWIVGFTTSAILVFIVNRRAFGWTLQFLPGEGHYAQLLGWGVTAALLGTLLPIFRMWRSPILAAIREE